jgi:hypothetical protein
MVFSLWCGWFKLIIAKKGGAKVRGTEKDLERHPNMTAEILSQSLASGIILLLSFPTVNK